MRVEYTDFDGVGAPKVDQNDGDTRKALGGRKIVATVTDDIVKGFTLVANPQNQCIYFADASVGVFTGKCHIGQNSFTLHTSSNVQTFRFDAWGAPTSADDANRDGAP